jgi:hypothetical protein
MMTELIILVKGVIIGRVYEQTDLACWPSR